MRKVILIFLLFLLIHNLRGQGQYKIDSLENLLLTYDELKTNNDELDSIYIRLFNEYFRKDYRKALSIYTSGIALSKEKKESLSVIRWKTKEASLYNYYRQYDLALKSYSEILMALLASKRNTNIEIGWLLIEVGNIYFNLQDYVKSEDIFKESLVYFKNESDINGQLVVYNNLGLIANTLQKHKLAIKYFKKSERLNTDDQFHLNKVYNSAKQGLTYQYMMRKDSCQYYFKAAFDLLENVNDLNTSLKLNSIYAYALIQDNRLDSAILVLNRIIKTPQLQEMNKELAQLYLLLAIIYHKKKDLNKAVFMIKNSINKDSMAVLSIYDINPYLEASSYYYELGDYKNALIMHKKHLELYNLIFNEKVWQSGSTFEKQRKLEEQELLLKDISIKETQQELLKLQIIAGLILIIFLSVIIFLVTKKNKISNRLNSLLEEKNKMINERNYQLSLKNKKISNQNIELNYKQIQIKKLLKKYEEDDQQKGSDERVKEVKSIKTFENFELVSIETQINEALSLFDKKLIDIKIIKEIEENLPFCYCNYQEMISLWSNLLENSISSISVNGQIHIAISSKDEYIVVKIKDNGHGIEESEYENIFKPFVSYSNNSDNKGLGLYIVKKIIEKHSGDIFVKSELNKYTEFTVLIPLNQ